MFKIILFLSLGIVALGKILPTSDDFIAGIKAAGDGFLPEEISVESLIVGGETASPGQFPYIASLRSAGNAHFCGGFLTNNRWIVSTAHCTVGRTVINTISILGAISRINGGTRYNSAQIVIHPNYDSNTIANDVSLVQTSTPVTFTDRIQPIALGSDFIGGGVPAVVSGWGMTSGEDSGASLQFIHVQTITNDECRNNVGGNGHLIFDHKICTAGTAGRGPCGSGVPLAAGNTAIGIVSWGIGCANGFADIYDRISSHRRWIVEHF